MCIEDVLIGRNTETRVHTVTVGTTSTLVVSGNPNRISLLFGSDGTVDFWVGPRQNIVAAGGSVLVANGVRPITFYIGTHGQLVTADWWGLVAASTLPIFVVETLFLGDVPPKTGVYNGD